MVRVAALYVSPGGPYMHMPDVDAWDEARDARLYDGPYPVVAHPACGPWGRVYWRYKGSEGGADCALHAVESVRAFGGVLEHPRESNLWGKRSSKRKTYAKRPVGVLDPPLPGEPPDTWGGYTIEVEQVSWGHPCVKPTWLYIVGCRPENLPPRPSRVYFPTHEITTKGYANGGLPELPKKKRHLTPPAFARWLTLVASNARG